MIETGFEIGAHSHSHVKVGQQEEQKALLEVELPKKFSKKNFGCLFAVLLIPRDNIVLFLI
jgi:hypothetical protein